MPQPTSRYASTAIATSEIGDGAGGRRTVRYLRRRFPPQPAALPTLAEHVVTRGDRIDLIANTYLGDPEQYWRVCDANAVLRPAALTGPDRIGDTLRVPIPQI